MKYSESFHSRYSTARDWRGEPNRGARVKQMIDDRRLSHTLTRCTQQQQLVVQYLGYFE